MEETRTLVGAWRLLRYWTRYDGGPVLHPLGERPVGLMLYGPDGHMCGTMQRADPLRFAVPDRLAATVDEKARAFDDYVTYCGRWRSDGRRVWHRVEASLMPNWIGEEQEREIRWLDDDRVELVGAWSIGTRRREAVVEWRRERGRAEAHR
jgi:hypothetical protein